MSQTKIEKMISAWIGDEASYLETELPEETGLLDLAVLIASRVLRGFAAGADRFAFEVDTTDPALWECVNATERGSSYKEPEPGASLQEIWAAHAELHEEHRAVPDTAPWLKVREDAAKAKVGARFTDGTVDALAEVVSAAVYHLVLNGACRILVELRPDLCIVMTPEAVPQEAVDRSLDNLDRPRNAPLTELRAGDAE